MDGMPPVEAPTTTPSTGVATAVEPSSGMAPSVEPSSGAAPTPAGEASSSATPTLPPRAAVPLRKPAPRGPISTALLAALRRSPGAVDLGPLRAAVAARLGDPAEWRTDEDVQLALLCLYELHYRGIAGVDDDWEWDPDLLAVRAELEVPFEAELRRAVPVPECDRRDRTGVAERLFALTAADGGPSLSRYVARKATGPQLRELLVHRSIYQLKEADPHTWAIPRLAGGPKAALVEIQADEYGDGDPHRMHAELFALAMRAFGLDDTYGAYVDHVPAVTLASLNAMSLFGLHRRLRGAIVGHLAAFEMTSSLPNRLYGNGVRRLGHDDVAATWYFDEHVAADAVHEQIAGRDLAGALAEQEPELVDDILFGAACCLALDGATAARMMRAWDADGTSLLRPLP
ncbi:hypothetical protein CELL_00123 [Cellulomonas sp. T2.31MG-18]